MHENNVSQCKIMILKVFKPAMAMELLCVLIYASLNGENGAVFWEGRQALRNKDSISQSADRQRYLQPHCNAAKKARGA